MSAARERAWRLALAVAGIVVAIDQLLKAAVDQSTSCSARTSS